MACTAEQNRNVTITSTRSQESDGSESDTRQLSYNILRLYWDTRWILADLGRELAPFPIGSVLVGALQLIRCLVLAC